MNPSGCDAEGREIQENFIDERTAIVDAPAAAAFRAVCRVGGATGWHHGHWLWQLRGWMDELAGGPGLRRGRRDPQRLEAGDIVDFWRVAAIECDRRLELRAEMRAPGEAWLTFLIDPIAPARCRLTQRARFHPHGVAGRAYWYAVAPFHAFVFPGLLRGLVESAQADHAARAAD